jgi:polyisoprenoid-binding protein YceI
MKNRVLLFLGSLIISGSINAQEKFSADKEKTSLSWLGEKVTGQHTGTIMLQSGWLNLQGNKVVSGEIIIDMTTIKESEGNEKLMQHLKSDDFFGVEKFPTSKLVIAGSSSFDKGSGLVQGNLTIKGVTNPIEFKAAMQKTDDGIRFFANITVDRTKYNIRYGSGTFFDNLGDKTIYDEFKLKVNLLVKK